MKFFDYEKLYLEARGDANKLVKLFLKAPHAGPNFIVNPCQIRVMAGYSNRALAEYLGLCALRRYENYVYFKNVDLERHLIPPWIPMTVVQNNPLTQLTDTTLIFKKENDLWL